MPRSSKRVSTQEIKIPSEAGYLNGFLNIPESAEGLVIFAHGSGSGRHSPRNQFVATFLNEDKLGTLLMDLLTPEEEEIDLLTRQLRFDIDLLSRRLEEATDYVGQIAQTSSLQLGYFGSSTGAAAALIAAARQGSSKIKAVVSRGGRPDLAGAALSRVKSPTLLIVGGNDVGVIELNEQALEQIKCEKRMEIVSGARHLFEEPGALEEVAKLARSWFEEKLVKGTKRL